MTKRSKSYDADALHARREAVIGRLLLRAARAFEARAVARIHDAGHANYRSSDNLVLIHLDTRGNRISELAERAGVSKQAISKVVRDLVARGIVTKEKDEEDGRAQIVRFTDAGLEMMLEAFDVVFDLDEEFATLLPEGNMERMREDLITMLDALDPGGF